MSQARPDRPQPDVGLRSWSPDDLELMERLLGDPAMTEHLGGPESPEKLRSRLVRYLQLRPENGRMYVVTVGPEHEPAGSVGYWRHDGSGAPTLETGWSVLREFQGRGVATLAMQACLGLAAANTDAPTIHAYPSVDNAPSNALCRRLGFELLGASRFEYPKGHWMVCNDWSFDLEQLRRASVVERGA